MEEFKDLLKPEVDIDFLPKKQEMVLIETAFKGNSYPFGFKNMMRVSTAQRAIKSLVDKRLLRAIKNVPWHAGMKKRIYKVTPFGFSVAWELCTPKHQKSFMERLIANNKSVIPLVLGEWDYFKKRGVEKDALERLGLVTKYFVKSYHGYFRDLWEECRDRSDGFSDIFTKEFYSLFPDNMGGVMPDKKNLLRWYKVLTKNQNIRPIVLKMLEEELMEAKYHGSLVEEIMARTKSSDLPKK